MSHFHRVSSFGAAKTFCGTKWGCGAKSSTLSPGVGLLRRKMALKEDGILSGIVAHLQGRRRTFMDNGVLTRKDAHFRDDSALARKTTHFSDCVALGTIAVRPSKCGAHYWRSSGARYAAFQSAGVACFLHSFLRIPYFVLDV